jgi:biotin carboxylase
MSLLVVIGANAEVAAAAETLGVGVVHVQLPDAAPLEPPGGLTGKVVTADYRDHTAFLEFVDAVLKPLAPAAVVSLTEFGLEPAALAGERLGTPGTPSSVVRLLRDKLLMRDVLELKAPALNPAFAAGDDPEGIARLFAAHTPVVVKPADGAGSSDVALVRSLAELRPERRSPGTVLEEFVGGTEFSIETLSEAGRHTVVGIAEKGTTSKGFVEVSHVMPPYSLGEPQRRLVVEAVETLLDAVGLTDGPSHTEVKVETGDGVRVAVIESHNRLGGDGIADLVRITRGVDWRRAALGWPVGAGLREEGVEAPAAATVFFTAAPGRVTAVAPQPALTHGQIVRWSVTAAVGDVVRPLRSSSDRLGVAVLTAADPRGCAAAVAELTGMRIVTTEPDL